MTDNAQAWTVYNSLMVDPLTHTVYSAGEEVHLPEMEYQLLYYFLQHPGQTLSRKTLMLVQEHRRLIILAGDGIVDVGERPGLGELVAHLEDPVRPDATNGNAVLHAARNEELYTLLFPRFGQGLDQWRLSLRLRFFCFGFFIRIPPWIAS